MSGVNAYSTPAELLLGLIHNERVPRPDQDRQRSEVEHILRSLSRRPGIVLADEVGMGKTFVALAVAYCVSQQSRKGPVIIMAPANLIDKWEQDLKTFCELYLRDRRPVWRGGASSRESDVIRYAVARHSVELMKLLDDPPRDRCHLILLAQGAMGRTQNDRWVRLALIRETLRRHGRGKADRLIKVKRSIHRFMGELLWAIGKERASDWGDQLWRNLLESDPNDWRAIYNDSVQNERHVLDDDPVPAAVLKALRKTDLRPLAEALQWMPVRARGSSDRVSERIDDARAALRYTENDLWKRLLAKARWRSPLLIMDEAHHLKNPGTSLARQLQSTELETDLRTGDGAMARAFERMLFLTATPFQLGHRELVRVLERFGDVRWDAESLGDRAAFADELRELEEALTESQRAAIALQRSWQRLRPEEGPADDPDGWWNDICRQARDELTPRQKAVLMAYEQTREWREKAEKRLKPWLIRHNKGEFWTGTSIIRRHRRDGVAVVDDVLNKAGLEVPSNQMLPFFLAARSAVTPGRDLLGDALCSSYEAFRLTRQKNSAEVDEREEETTPDFSHSAWYLEQFDHALEQQVAGNHPKVATTVQKAVDLWESGEKVLVFAFYRQTCRALRIHISREIEKRITTLAKRRFAGAQRPITEDEIDGVIDSIQNRYFDAAEAPGRRALDSSLREIAEARGEDWTAAGKTPDEQEGFVDVMRRFLRVRTTLIRCFPIHRHDELEHREAVRMMLDAEDASGVSWRQKFTAFLSFLLDQCSTVEREGYIQAASRMQTGGIRVLEEDLDAGETREALTTLANVQVATGRTRRDARSRLMRAFNTPFFPDVLVCSEVMGEGVDLQRYCRHVIHHDLAWNPSTIEQRTGRIDRIGCKAEGRHPIFVYLPYLSGTADERQYHVMTDREQWFRIVMGQDEVAKLIPCDSDGDRSRLPKAFSTDLTFKLALP
jgi:ERCC4-related helicase